MGKVIKYKFLSCEINHGTEENPDIERMVLDKEILCKTEAIFEFSLPIAVKEAYNGEYIVEDDGEGEEISPEQRIAELEEALDLLLTGVTE